jgi:hypothetical protein
MKILSISGWNDHLSDSMTTDDEAKERKDPPMGCQEEGFHCPTKHPLENDECRSTEERVRNDDWENRGRVVGFLLSNEGGSRRSGFE